MAETKDKRAVKKAKKNGKPLFSKTVSLIRKKKAKGTTSKGKGGQRNGRSGPRLPSSLRKQLEASPSTKSLESESDGDEGVLGEDVYEYEERIPEEESKKNRRYDPVENYEYELPEEFEDEDVPSDDDDEEIPSDESDGEEGGDRHLRMLQGITGIPGEAFQDKGKKKVVLSDFQGDSGGGQISIHDLLDPLHGKAGYSKLRKRLDQLEKKAVAVPAPLPRVEREKLERKVAYEHSKKDITKWEPLVKRNREAPTLFFEEDVDLGFSTVGAIAAEFEPRTEFEKKMASLVLNPEVVEAHQRDGARLLELNKISVEDVRDRQNRLAKMRSLLFRHEMKSKHIKKIKSKTYHRILKKERMKAASTEMQMDPEAAKEHAKKQEIKRAEERMTLKHKNTSQWAKRILKRGLDVQDEGTRAAIAEQLHQNALLTRKMNSMKDSTSSDESSDDDEDLSPERNSEVVSKLLNKAKEKTVKVVEEDDEMSKSGVFALPFMERGLKRRQEAANEEARLALQDYDTSLKELEDGNLAGSPKEAKVSGRRVFGVGKKHSQESRKRKELDDIQKSSDNEDDFEATEQVDVGHVVDNESQEISIALYDESEARHDPLFKSFSDITKDSAPQTTYEVALFASDSWKKVNSRNVVDCKTTKSAVVDNLVMPNQDMPDTNLKEMDQHSDSDSDEGMVDGILSSGGKPDYELPSQAELIHSAFAGDDVEAEFEKDKMEILNEENPEPEKPVLLPGWGQWTHVQKKKGMPSWMLKEYDDAKKKREEALKKRKDANLKHVTISERVDKKAEKLLAPTLPYPYTSKEVYEHSIRMPIGPEFNPAISVGALNRPAVVKKPGVIIKPIQFQEVDPHDKQEEPKRIVQKPNAKKPKLAGSKHTKKAGAQKRR